MEFTRVGALAEIPEGEVRAYDTPTGRVAVAHVEAHVYAFGDECTHQGCSLAETGTLRRPRRHGGVRVPRQRLRRGAGRAARRSGGGSGSGVPGADRGRLGRGGGGAGDGGGLARRARLGERRDHHAEAVASRDVERQVRTGVHPPGTRRSRTTRRRPGARGRASTARRSTRAMTTRRRALRSIPGSRRSRRGRPRPPRACPAERGRRTASRPSRGHRRRSHPRPGGPPACVGVRGGRPPRPPARRRGSPRASAPSWDAVRTSGRSFRARKNATSVGDGSRR